MLNKLEFIIDFFISHRFTEAESSSGCDLMVISWANCIFNTKAGLAWDSSFFDQSGSAIEQCAGVRGFAYYCLGMGHSLRSEL